MIRPVPDRPRRDYVKKMARKFLLSSEQDSLPINVESLFKPPEYLLYDAAKAEQVARMSIPINFWNTGSVDALTCYYGGTFITIYKSIGRTTQRIRFSIAHELGHIVLNHLTDYEQPNSFSVTCNKEYHVLEREADMFAAELLAPTPLLNAIGLRDVANIQRVCDISETAADITVSDMNLNINVSKTDENALLRRFHRYIFTNEYNLRINEAVCSRCYSQIPDDYSFCHVCGAEIIYKTHGAPRTFTKPQTTQNGRLLFCTKCRNTRFRGGQLQCDICGQPLYNKCTEPEHKKLLPGSARYCPICGKKTTYFISGIIPDWSDDILLIKQENSYFDKSREGLKLSVEWHYWVHSILLFNNYELYEKLRYTEAILDEDDLIVFSNTTGLSVDYIKAELLKYCDMDIVSVTFEKEEG